MPKIPKSDAAFVRNVLLPWSGVKSVKLALDDSTKKWPDIWVQKTSVPIITVTSEWLRQSIHERRKRLVHEFLHLCGVEHNDKIGYNTIPAKDLYSMKIYRRLI